MVFFARWGLGNHSANTVKILEFSEENMAEFIDINIIRKLLSVSNNISGMELPSHLLIIVMLVMLFSRDGIMMDSHCAIDTARAYYLHLLYRYIKLYRHQGDRLYASLHSLLQMVKEFGEEMRTHSVEA